MAEAGAIGVSMNDIPLKLISVALVILSASLHEFGHAFAAYRCGDPTAKEQGRLTLNPLAHIDPFGSVLLPVLLVLSGMGYIAYAKPVPYNPNRLKNPKRDEVIVAFAGPIANILQAVVGAVVFRALDAQLDAGNRVLIDSFQTGGWAFWLMQVLYIYISVNCSLAFFNLLPIPPLDGSAIISPLLSGEARRTYYQVQRYALPITLGLIWLLPRFTGINPIGWWFSITADPLFNLLIGR